MKETLTAKEWLEKEELIWNYTAIPSIMLKKPEIETFMEQYANYKNKELENKIVEFRNKFKDVAMLRRIDEYFNIK
jgi:hypothetical protein